MLRRKPGTRSEPDGAAPTLPDAAGRQASSARTRRAFRSSSALLKPKSQAYQTTVVYFLTLSGIERCRRAAIQPSDYHSKYYRQNTVEDDLLNYHFSWHRLHDEVDHVGWHDRQQCNGDSKAQALCHPWLRLDAARIDPDERSGQNHMR